MNPKLRSSGNTLARLFAVLAASLLLSSCFEFSEEFWVDEDGGGRMKVEMGLSTQMAAVAQLGRDRSKQPFKNPFENAEEDLSEDSNVERVEVREETRGDMLFYITDITVKDLAKITETFNQSMSQGEGPAQEIGLTKLENGNLKFVQPLNFDAATQSKDAGNLFAAGMMAAMFQGRHMTIRIHGNIVSANGIIAEDGKSVEWKFPLADIVAGRISLEQAEAEISLKRGLHLDPKLLMIFLGAIGVVVIAAVAFLLGKEVGHSAEKQKAATPNAPRPF